MWLTEVQVWNAPGQSTATQRFDAWGTLELAAGSVPTYGYTGREPDATGLIHYRARYYHPELGRFVSRDPLGLSAGINPYAYADGNPVLFNDPDGLLAAVAWNSVGLYYGQAREWLSTTASNVGQSLQNGVVYGMFKTDAQMDEFGAGLQAAQAQGPQSLANFLRQPGNLPGSANVAFASIAVTGGASLLQSGRTFTQVAGVADDVFAAKGTATGAESAVNGLKLNKSLASQAQMSEAGTTMAGAGARVPFRDAARIAKEYGGSASDWVKKSSSSHTARDGTTFETHWVENIRTGQRVEFKTKFPGGN